MGKRLKKHGKKTNKEGDASQKQSSVPLVQTSLDSRSQKQLKTAHTQRPLHVLVKVQPVTTGERAVHAISTGTFANKNIWDREAFEKMKENQKIKISSSLSSGGEAAATPVAKKRKRKQSPSALRGRLSVLCAQELKRHIGATKSREKLQKLANERCSNGGSIVLPIMAWERWQACSKLAEQVHQDKVTEWFLPMPASSDIPLAEDFGTQSLSADLERLQGVTQACGEQIAIALAKDSNERALSLTQGSGKCAELPTVKRCKHSVDVLFRKKLLKINIPHMEKLKDLYEMGKTDQRRNENFCERSNSSSVEGREAFSNSIEVDGFNAALYMVLQRYNSLLGHGMQCACSEHVFDALKDTLKVNFECFASPLNARFPRYCSAFPDTDACFGSIGSFFQVFRSSISFLQYFPEGGSFEANPPFIPRVMDEMVNFIEKLMLNVHTVALSFVLVLPGWTDEPYWQKIVVPKRTDHSKNDSKDFVRHVAQIAAQDHGFVSGAQHQRKDRFLDSNFDTVVVVLQNKKGKRKYPIPPDFQDQMREAFRKSLPTQAMRERRRKEGRGFADKDGGGGVYKGKRRNSWSKY